jgi:hypothetical protein
MNCVKGPTAEKNIVEAILSLAKPMKHKDKMFAFMVSGALAVHMEYGINNRKN